MITSLQKKELQDYISQQLNNFFPDKDIVNLNDQSSAFQLALDKLDFCFQRVSFNRYYEDGQTKFNHLYADQFLMFIWFLSNTIYNQSENDKLASKLYYLNKSLHGLDCMFDTELPDIFLIFHGVGTVLGKAKYSNYFVALQGCTIGSHRGKYPVMGQGVGLTAHSSIIGDCQIGNRVSISSNTGVFEKDIPSNSVAFKDQKTGILSIKPTSNSYAQSFFNLNITEIEN